VVVEVVDGEVHPIRQEVQAVLEVVERVRLVLELRATELMEQLIRAAEAVGLVEELLQTQVMAETAALVSLSLKCQTTTGQPSLVG